MIELICSSCGKTLSIPEQYAGQSGKCNHCRAPIQVPKRPVGIPEASVLGQETGKGALSGDVTRGEEASSGSVGDQQQPPELKTGTSQATIGGRSRMARIALALVSAFGCIIIPPFILQNMLYIPFAGEFKETGRIRPEYETLRELFVARYDLDQRGVFGVVIEARLLDAGTHYFYPSRWSIMLRPSWDTQLVGIVEPGRTEMSEFAGLVERAGLFASCSGFPVNAMTWSTMSALVGSLPLALLLAIGIARRKRGRLLTPARILTAQLLLLLVVYTYFIIAAKSGYSEASSSILGDQSFEEFHQSLLAASEAYSELAPAAIKTIREQMDEIRSVMDSIRGATQGLPPP